MSVSRLDQLYRRLLLTKFFTKGWGKPDNLKRLFDFRKILSNRETCQSLVASDYPITIDKEYRDGDCRILEGHFPSPFIQHLPGIMPKEVETASFQMLLPVHWQHPTLRPVCIHLAGTGDHFFWRRRLLTARPLLKEAGIASILLENPYYGTRKPKQQLRSSLHNVSDLFVMGGALVLESMALLHWCEREGWGPLGISGVSMGGHMASGLATLWPKPISVVPILSWTTASVIFTEGVMSGAIPWQTLQEQFFENSVYQDEIKKLIISPERNGHIAYDMGQQFVKDYSHSVEQVEKRHQQTQTQVQQTPHLSTPPVSSENPAPVISQDEEKSGTIHSAFIQSRSSETNARLEVFHGVDQKLERDQSRLMNSEVNANNKDINLLSNSNRNNSATDKDMNLLLDGSSNAKEENVNLSPEEYIGRSSQVFPPSSYEESAVPEKLSRKQKKGKKESLALNYAQAKQSQQPNPRPSIPEKSTLSLRHALAKSKLLMSRQSAPSSLPMDAEQLKTLQHESLDFMRGVMDECTHLGNFSVPVDPELVIIVSAKQDAYIPRDGVLALDQLWPGCEVRYIEQGHVGAVLFNQSVFRKAVIDAFEKQVKKYYSHHGTLTSSQVKVHS